MDFVPYLYVAGLIISACISAWISWHSWRLRATSHTPAFTVVMLSVTWWLATSVLDILSPDPFQKILIIKLGYIGVLALPVAWIAFSLQYSGRGHLLTPLRLVLLGLIPAALLGMIASGSLWSEIQFKSWGPFLHISVNFTPWIWPQLLFEYSLNLAGSVILARHVIGLPRIYRYQTIALMIGAVIPLGVNVLYQLSVHHDNEYDLTAISFALSGIAIAWGLYRYKLFTLLPIARNVLVENMPAGFVVLSDSFTIADVNPAALAMMACTRASCMGKPIARVFPPCAALVEQIQAGSFHPIVIELASSADASFCEVQAVKINQGKGDVLSYLVILLDISQRMLTEEGLKKALAAEKDLYALRSRLVANTSHEFRTPLSVIFSSAELLEHYGDTWSPAKRLEHIQRIKGAVQHMTRMVDDILLVGRTDANKVLLKPVPIELVSFCETLLEETRLKDQGRHIFSFVKTVPECTVTLDELLLRQIISNLLENAAKYSLENTSIRLDLTAAGGCWRLDLSDQGFGIPTSDLLHLGEPFYRGENVGHLNGTGLGLTIVMKSLELIGGQIEFYSVENQGTHVSIQVPIQAG